VALSGDIHLWQIKTPDNWAAFAQDFEELEENIEYDEREDEFDIVCSERDPGCGVS
jgi:COMPASS component SWD1